MRYRYITSGRCSPHESIRAFRLVSHRVIGKLSKPVGSVIYRIEIPHDMTLTKYSCDEYWETGDVRTIEELNYRVMMVMWDGKLRTLPVGANIDEVAKEQFQKWQKSLFTNPEKAYRLRIH